MTVCSCHATYSFESESTLYSCLNVKERLPQIWSLSDCDWIGTKTISPIWTFLQKNLGKGENKNQNVLEKELKKLENLINFWTNQCNLECKQKLHNIHTKKVNG